MNANLKAPNNTAPQMNFGSFVSAPVNAVKNVANNAANSMKNAFNNIAPLDISEPINNSINATIESTPSPLVSIPVIVTLGVLIVLFIIVVIFREQIAVGLELAWEKIKEFLGLTKPAVQPPPPQYVP